MKADEWDQLADLLAIVEKAVRGDEPTKNEDQATIATLRPPKSAEDVCSSCGGVVVTVVFGGDDRPQIRFRLGSMGRRHIQLHNEGGSKPAHTPPRREVLIKCGGCGASLIRFEGRAYD